MEIWILSDKSIKELENIYKRHDNFNIETNSIEETSLNYEYFYDGTYVYIIINYGIFNGADGILRWNSKIGDDSMVTLIGYIIEQDKNIRVIEY